MKKNHLIVIFCLLLNGFALQAASNIGLFSAITLSKKTIVEREPLSLSVQLKNYGADNFDGEYHINAYDSTGKLVSEYISFILGTLPANSSTTLTFNVATTQLRANKTYILKLFYEIYSPFFSTVEINSENGYENKISLTVLKPPFPELSITSNVTSSKNKILEGDPFTIHATIENYGGVAYQGAFAARTKNGEEVQQLTGQTIKVDSSIKLTFSTLGMHQLKEGNEYEISIYYLDSNSHWSILYKAEKYIKTKTTVLVTTAISQIRWGSIGDPLNGLTLSWTSPDSSSQIKWGYSTSLEKGLFDTQVKKGYDRNYFFNYQFPGVSPNATIYYQLYSPKKCTDIKIYRTAPPSDTKNFSFNVIGDSRNGLDVWKNVSQLAGSKNTAFTLFNGDIVDHGNSNTEWDGWFHYGVNYLEKNLIFHALGNHEAGIDSDVAKKYYENIFELPKNPNGSKLYYTTQYGNALFIVLNSETIYNHGDTAQLNWLRNILSSANNDASIKWKIISFHRPFFNIGSHGGEMDSFRSTYWKAFDDYGVDLILNGHDHNYQRFKPINLNVSTSSPVPQYGSGAGKGRCQIICGGAGAPFYDKVAQAPDMWAIDQFNMVNHFVNAEVNDCKMNITVYRMDGVIIDNFSLNKCNSAISYFVGINEKNDVFNPIQVIPNPAFGLITVKCQSKEMGKGVINIYDLAGKCVLSETIEKNNELFSHECDLSRLSSSAYQLGLTVNQKTDRTILFKK